MLGSRIRVLKSERKIPVLLNSGKTCRVERRREFEVDLDFGGVKRSQGREQSMLMVEVLGDGGRVGVIRRVGARAGRGRSGARRRRRKGNGQTTLPGWAATSDESSCSMSKAFK